MEVPLSSPVAVAQYPFYSAANLLAGFAATALFFVYQMRSGAANRSLAIELAIALVASAFLGCGALFTMLAFNLYV
jgi:hypothetical protein